MACKIDWNAYYAKEGSVVDYAKDPLVEPRCRAIWTVFPREKVASLADIGCGDGQFCDWIADRAGIKRVVGLDLSRPRIERAKTRFPKVEFHCGTVAELPFEDGEFDVVTCIESLEHQVDPDVALRELARVSRKYIVISVPDRGTIHTLLCPHCLRTFPASGHLHSFDNQRLAKMAEATTLRVERCRTFDPKYDSKHLLIRWIRKGLRVLERPPRAMYLMARMVKQ